MVKAAIDKQLAMATLAGFTDFMIALQFKTRAS
jgi:hypothetical protein